MTLDAAGNLGVGTTSSLKAVTSASNTTTNYQFTARDTRSMAINVGGGIAFEGNDGSIADRAFSAIIGAKENATSGNYAGYLAFYSRANGSSPTESARITSDGYLRMASGSGGIQFNGDTAAANALDDYEQGTWTPTDASGAGLTITSAEAKYTKVGNLVFVRAGSITYPATADGTSATIGGLPFTNSAGDVTTGSLISASASAQRALIVSSTSNALVYANGTATPSSNADLSSVIIYGFSAVYSV
jgi:hypothetical protein